MLYEESKLLRKIVEPQGFTLGLVGPKEREAIRALLEEVERLHDLVEARGKLAERTGNELIDLRCGLGRLVESVGIRSDDLDDEHLLAVLGRHLPTCTVDPERT